VVAVGSTDISGTTVDIPDFSDQGILYLSAISMPCVRVQRESCGETRPSECLLRKYEIRERLGLVQDIQARCAMQQIRNLRLRLHVHLHVTLTAGPPLPSSLADKAPHILQPTQSIDDKAGHGDEDDEAQEDAKWRE